MRLKPTCHLIDLCTNGPDHAPNVSVAAQNRLPFWITRPAFRVGFRHHPLYDAKDVISGVAHVDGHGRIEAQPPFFFENIASSAPANDYLEMDTPVL